MSVIAATVLLACVVAVVPALRTGVLSVIGTAFGAETSQAAVQVPETFIQQARRALARGRLAEAEALAKTKPAGDPDGAAVLARVASARGRYDEALQLLQPGAAANPTGEAALELGLLLQRQFGRDAAAAEHLNRVLGRGLQASDGEALFRAARAAQALGKIRPEAESLYRVASRSGDPAVETAFGELFLETDNLPEALKSFQIVIKTAADWAPAHVGIARTISGENPPRLPPRRRRRSRSTPSSPTPTCFSPSSISTTRGTTRRASVSTACSRLIPRISMPGRCSAPSPTSATTGRRSRRSRRACSP